MVDTEEYFPRGGKPPVVRKFKTNSNFLGAPERSGNKKRKLKKKAEADDGYLSDEGAREVDPSVRNSAIGLSLKTVKTGVLVLGRVKLIFETKVQVMLPGRMVGSVMACHVSEAYNKLLEAYVNDEIEKVRELSQMFRPGQYVATRVLEAEPGRLMLSLMPQHVNGAVTHGDLHKGTILQAAVTSVEDHGYIMDIGILSTRAFLPKNSANPELELEVGMLSWCVVKSVSPAAEGSVVTLSSHLDALQAGIQKQRPRAPLLPATAVHFTVDKALESGIEGRVFGDTTAFVQRQHVDTVNGKKPALGQRVRARVLYVMPTRNAPFLTLRDIFETTHPDLGAEQKFKPGDIVERAQVVKITGRILHFKLCAGSVGTMAVRDVPPEDELTDEQVLAQSYPIGSTHEVRVLFYNLSDYTYSVSDQPSVLEEEYFSIDQLVVGQTVRAVVRAVSDTGLSVGVGRVPGFVPQAHITDSGVFVDPVKPTKHSITKKFKVGQEVSARVLSIDLSREQRPLLTMKPSLLAPGVEALQSYEQAEVGKAYIGVIRRVSGDYVIVRFFSDVSAYVPRGHVSREPVESLVDAFHVGQIMSCTILNVTALSKKMLASFTTPPFSPAKHPSQSRPDDEERKSRNRRSKRTEESHDQQSDETEKDLGKKKKNKKPNPDECDTLETNISQKKSERKNDKSPESEDGKKKKGKKSETTDESGLIETHMALKKKDRKRNKDKQSKNTEESDTSNTNIPSKKRKTSVNGTADTDSVKSKEMPEESDAIETDIYDDSDVLSPMDMHLVDLTDCATAKNYKKRVVSLLKAINARTRRLETIEMKIAKIEEKGLTPKTKVFHTAMHTEKLLKQKCIERLLEVLKVAQNKLLTFDEVNTDYKKEQKEKKKRNKLGKEDGVVDNKDVGENGNDVEFSRKSEVKSRDIKVVESLEPALEVPSAKDFWNATVEVPQTVKGDESSRSEDEEQDQPKKKRKKLSVAEKLAKVREEEERVREMERRAIESEAQPRSTEQFERALLASPDCSQLWIAYMAFHLQATEIDKARAIGRKALSAISFREERERRNVWLALLNCEHRFGTKESQQKTLEDALQMNEPYAIHSALLDILVETGKPQELSSLVDIMLRKYRRQPPMYTECGAACYKAGLVEKARQLMQKAITVLEKKLHVSILVQFALLERSLGARDRAEALFEQVLAVYPQRVDVCAVYADMLLKAGDSDRVRQVMERMTSHKLSARKMKVLYRKWIEVEEKYGDPARMDAVRQRALQFIEKAKF